MLEEKLDRIAVALEKLCALVAEMPKGETKAPATREKKEKVKETTKPGMFTPEGQAELRKEFLSREPEPQTIAPDMLAQFNAPIVHTVDPNMKQMVQKTQPLMENPKTPETAVITVEQLRATIIEVQQKKGPAIAKKIVQEVGNAPQVTKIEVSKYQMVMDACKAALNG